MIAQHILTNENINTPSPTPYLPFSCKTGGVFIFIVDNSKWIKHVKSRSHPFMEGTNQFYGNKENVNS